MFSSFRNNEMPLNRFSILYHRSFPIIDTAYFAAVNAPWIFKAVFSMVKPLLNPRTTERIHIESADSFRSVLQKFLDREDIPIPYGGTREEVWFLFITCCTCRF